ncbi:MAG: dissimilatory-type sulfite reductase subunit alpha [Deltaproteobacteria bacterium]|nr:dissimilatory-type sulfite reductase subunit alpha [Deltaproteobacteria bacterium]
MAKFKTPLIDELEKGPWPSFILDIKRQAKTKPELEDLLGQLELSYKDKETHWKHGGIVGVFGYGGGVIGRYSDMPHEFPGVAHFHTVRVNQTGGFYYSTEYLGKIMDMWERRGSGLTNMHGSTGDMVLLGTTTPQLEEIFWELTHDMNTDLGGSGGNLRTPSCCLGMSRCEYACIDAQNICHDMTMTYQDELHRPAFPYKFKIKVSGCPNDCVAAIARSDFAIIGTWRDNIRIDQAAVQGYVNGELKPNAGAHAGRDWGKFDIVKEVVNLCPSKCMGWDGKELKINNKDCVRCMHCIDVMPRALRPGLDKGCSILCGAKAPILEGQRLATLIVPFMKMEPPYDECKGLLNKILDWWMENGKNRERVGECIGRMGMREFLKAVDLPAIPQMVKEPRSNPYIFWEEKDVPGGWVRDLAVFRKKHPL